MESNSSSDLTHLNEELPKKIEENKEDDQPDIISLRLLDKEDDQPDIISLRLLDLTDVDDFMEWFGDDNVSKFCSWDTFKSKEDAMNYVIDVAIPHPWFRAICLNGKPVGSISVSAFHGTDKCRGELGYVLVSKYWGKGIATKAVKMAAAAIFVEWPHLERLEAVVAVDNPGSQRVLEKAGFTKEGVLRKYYLLKGKPKDIVMFSLLSTDQQVTYFMLKLSDHEHAAADGYSDISLRLLDLNDVDDFMEWFADENVNKFCSCDTFTTSKEDAMRYIADIVIPHPWFRAICLNGKPIGSVSVSPFHGSNRCRGEIGYELASKYWGKGIATKAVKMVAAAIFAKWPHLERLEAVVAVDNPGSQRVLEKAGFRKEGVLRKYYLLNGEPKDIVMFSLLSSDPQVT